jgi:hypothetical protein
LDPSGEKSWMPSRASQASHSPVGDHSSGVRHAAFQLVAQGLAFDQLADDVDEAILAADVVYGNDVGMIERAGRARLLLESLAAAGVAGDIRWKHLEGDGAGQAVVAGAIDFAHAARAQKGNDLVRADPGAGG